MIERPTLGSRGRTKYCVGNIDAVKRAIYLLFIEYIKKKYFRNGSSSVECAIMVTI